MRCLLLKLKTSLTSFFPHINKVSREIGKEVGWCFLSWQNQIEKNRSLLSRKTWYSISTQSNRLPVSVTTDIVNDFSFGKQRLVWRCTANSRIKNGYETSLWHYSSLRDSKLLSLFKNSKAFIQSVECIAPLLRLYRTCIPISYKFQKAQMFIDLFFFFFYKSHFHARFVN